MDTSYVSTFPNMVRCPEAIHHTDRYPGTGSSPELRYMGPPLTPGKPGDAGIDLPAAQAVRIPSLSFGVVPIEVSVELPDGHWGWIIQRSSTFWKKRLLVNQAVIDNGYRGELFVAVYNLGVARYDVEAGERLAQLVLVPLVTPTLVHLPPDEFSTDTDRGTTGFGSTG
jgi:dUTP pyrophosphatase